ncbi:MAG: penicillin-binding protein 2 [Pseudomonadales bacterium]|nr:penicillin-binding protein 2 [Pseudomonadales bacterium]
MAEPLALKDHSGESQIFFDRVAVGVALFLILVVILVGRLFYLQVVQHDLYTTLSEKNRIQVQSIPPIRGLIYDRDGELIADNIPSYNLTITVERIDDLDETIATLAGIIDIDRETIDGFKKRLARRQRPFQPVPLKFRLSQEEIARVSVNRYSLPGVEIQARLVRHYPKGPLMAHAVGSVRRISEADARSLDPVQYSGTEHVGKIGVEKFYEPVLLGEVGYQRVEINARGRVMKVLDKTPPRPGTNLVLHVDADLQRVASEALGDRRGTVVAIEPSTGGILALVSKPSYDPNLFVKGIDYLTFSNLRDSIDTPLFNRAIRGQYEPGSTLKPFIGLTGLVTGIANPEYTIEDPGWFKLPDNDRLYRDWNWSPDGSGGHGEVDFEKAIYRSCNVYFYDLAVRLGIDRIHDHLALFGFGRNTVLDLPEARDGLLPSKAWKMSKRGEPWYPGDTVNIGIGQGDMLVTPMQLAAAVSVIANRGKWVPPRMLKEDTALLAQSPVERLPDIKRVPEHVWNLLIESMEEVVHRGNRGFGENGTAWYYIGQDIPYRMAGKSGTAQVVGIEQGEEYDEEELDERQRKHAWFIAFAPVDDPKIALAVLVENGGGGSEVAAPVARQVVDYHLLKQGIEEINLAETGEQR